MYEFLLSHKQPDGSFINSPDEDIDTRIVYCALAIAKCLNISVEDELFAGCADYILSCQTYEGGFAANCNGEAHAGYTYCSVAALAMLGKLKSCNVGALKVIRKCKLTRLQLETSRKRENFYIGCKKSLHCVKY